jgi:hypothetical protein
MTAMAAGAGSVSIMPSLVAILRNAASSVVGEEMEIPPVAAIKPV